MEIARRSPESVRKWRRLFTTSTSRKNKEHHGVSLGQGSWSCSGLMRTWTKDEPVAECVPPWVPDGQDVERSHWTIGRALVQIHEDHPVELPRAVVRGRV